MHLGGSGVERVQRLRARGPSVRELRGCVWSSYPDHLWKRKPMPMRRAAKHPPSSTASEEQQIISARLTNNLSSIQLQELYFVVSHLSAKNVLNAVDGFLAVLAHLLFITPVLN